MTTPPIGIFASMGALLVVGLGSCFPPVPEPPAPVSGYSWCVYADPAQGRIVGSETMQTITDPATGLWMSACTCYCPEDHAVVLAGVNGTVVPGSEAETYYAAQLSLLRTAAEIACLQRAIEIQMALGATLDFEAAGAVSCQAAVGDEVPQFGGECPFDEMQCQDGATGGLGTHEPVSNTAGSTGGTADERGDAVDTTGAPETETATGEATGTGDSGSDADGRMIEAMRER
jgi:hypothetical protein